MPIDHENCEGFYQGSFAEHHICSLFYLYGYEAQKVSPDVGIDLMVTNLARVRFQGEDPLYAEVQVKSVLLDANGAYAKMSAEELEYLSTGEHRYCVFVIIHGLRGYVDQESFERGDDPDASNAVDRDILRYTEQCAAADGRALRRDSALSIHDFNHVDLESFWLHSSQMKRMRDDGMWQVRKDGWFGLKIDLEDSSVVLAGVRLIPELSYVHYIVRRCRAGDRIRRGDLSMDDY